MSVPRARLSLQALRTWMSFNDAVSHGVKVQPVELKGNGLIAEESWSGSEQLPLLVIPHGLVLNQEAVDEYAKEDSNFSALLNACGRKVSPAQRRESVRYWRERLLTKSPTRVPVTTFYYFSWFTWLFLRSQRGMWLSPTHGQNMSSCWTIMCPYPPCGLRVNANYFRERRLR